MISFDLAAAARVIRFTEDEFNTVFFGFSFEQRRDKLFPIIEINLSGHPTFSESPLESVDR